jgi:acyl-coenzyme A synthetase/AMP-(fatty) acid ligase
MHPSGKTRTYREIDDASVRLAHVLRSRGLGVGDHIAVLFDNQFEFYGVVWAAPAPRLLHRTDQLAPHRGLDRGRE